MREQRVAQRAPPPSGDGPVIACALLSRRRRFRQSAVQRRVIAVLADEHLHQHRRCGECAGNDPLGSRRLGYGTAGPAGIFGTADAQHAKFCRNPVKHLADTLTNLVKPTTADSAARLASICIQQDVLACQMIWQELSDTRWAGFADRFGVFAVEIGNVGFHIFETQGQLIGVKLFRPAPVLGGCICRMIC